MIISIIAALDRKRGIGIDNKMPWHLPIDLKRFKKITMGHHLILGRKTYQSIGGPLPGRQMIILSRNPEYDVEGCIVCGSFDEALQLADGAGEVEVFVIGGGEVYKNALPFVERLYLSFVDTIAEADTYFPELKQEDWAVICEQEFPADEKNPLQHTFRYMVRNSLK
jgi:dihydrofolate reductase